ncbi:MULTISPECIES: hypothetical protein [Haloarcula]|uniref:hypothetical protein n=1 Tax=Haloarcula TaxID=2237 RepID=UPI0023EC31F1|nr:hypothetical protein [Halomicroarcula sp. XH51]
MAGDFIVENGMAVMGEALWAFDAGVGLENFRISESRSDGVVGQRPLEAFVTTGFDSTPATDAECCVKRRLRTAVESTT